MKQRCNTIPEQQYMRLCDICTLVISSIKWVASSDIYFSTKLVNAQILLNIFFQFHIRQIFCNI